MGLGSIPSCLYGGSLGATLDAYDAASLNGDMAKSDSLIKFSQLNRRLKCMNLLSALWLACLAISWYVQYFISRSNNRRLLWL